MKMRTNLVTCIIIALAMIICPFAAGTEKSKPEQRENQSAVNEENDSEYISVMSSKTGRVSKVELKEYVIGCVAAEMSPLYHTEALKAQAVACYTYAKRTGENKELDGADITDSPDSHQGYIDRDGRQEKWGEKFKEYEDKITAAVDAVFGEYMSFDGETVLAVYHANSTGRTQSAESLWGSEIPYLISVESPGDRLSPDYLSSSEFSKDELANVLESCGVEADGDADEWIEKINADSGGYVESLTVCGKKISCSDFRSAADLRSNCFDIEYDNGEFTVTCKGYGHGAGMSQYGADYMARQGFDYMDILAHYYTGVNFEKE